MAQVMIIDDDMTLSRILEEHLAADGHEVQSFTMAEEAIQRAVQDPPDLFLVDVMLPDATGFQVVGRLREHETTKSVPIIMITGTARHPNQQKIGKTIMGANEYLIKPFDMNAMSEKVRQLLPKGLVKRSVIPKPEKKAPIAPVPEPAPIPAPMLVPEPTLPPPPAPEPVLPPRPELEPLTSFAETAAAEEPYVAPAAVTFESAPEIEEHAAAMKNLERLMEEPAPSVAAKSPERQRSLAFPDTRWVAGLVAIQMAVTQSARPVLAGWALLLGLLMAACGALRIVLTAEQALGLLVWPAVPIVGRAIAALAGYKLDALTIAPQLFWTRPLDVFEMAAILILGINLRRLPGSSLLKAFLASALVAVIWSLTNRGYFQP